MSSPSPPHAHPHAEAPSAPNPAGSHQKNTDGDNHESGFFSRRADRIRKRNEELNKYNKPKTVLGTLKTFMHETADNIGKQFQKGLDAGSTDFTNRKAGDLIRPGQMLGELARTAFDDAKMLGGAALNTGKAALKTTKELSHVVRPHLPEPTDFVKQLSAKAVAGGKHTANIALVGTEAAKIGAKVVGYAGAGLAVDTLTGGHITGHVKDAINGVSAMINPKTPTAEKSPDAKSPSALPIFATDGLSPPKPATYIAPSGARMSPEQFSAAATHVNNRSGADKMFGLGDFDEMQRNRAAKTTGKEQRTPSPSAIERG